MSAAARAEARRKAILSRGTDRLAKLTTSARGEDAPAYMHDDPPLPRTGVDSFLGDDTDMSTPPARGSPSPSRNTSNMNVHNSPFGSVLGSGPTPDPSVWSEDQQMQFLQALMGGGPPPQSLPGLPPPPDSNAMPPDFMAAMGNNNPFAAMLQQAAMSSAAGGGVAAGKAPEQQETKTRTQKILPLLHLGAMWMLLAYFVLYVEPKVYEQSQPAGVQEVVWNRWARLSRETSLQVVPFFWAFTTIQIVLHSLRIFLGFDKVQPPWLLGMALPHLPPPFPSIIMNGLKYFQMWGVFANDISSLIVGMGFIVWLAEFMRKDPVDEPHLGL